MLQKVLPAFTRAFRLNNNLTFGRALNNIPNLIWENVNNKRFDATLSQMTLYFSEGKKDDVESGPEEEEVPTRGFLKRQANMIVDAKSRSKRGSRRRK